MKLSITEISNLTGFDRRRIRRALADLPSEKGPKGARLYESLNALPLLYLEGGGEVLDGTREKARLTFHQANIAELDEFEKRRTLVDREQVIEEVTQVHANMRAKLLNIAPKTATILVGLDDVAEVESVLEEAIHESLKELHNQYARNPLHDGTDQTAPETES